jgi:hypothetical protein
VKRLALVGLALLCACAPRVTRAPGEKEYFRVAGLELSATVERDRSDVLGAVDVMNAGDDTVRLEYEGYCALSLRFRPERGRGAWDSSTWWARRGDCPTGNVTLTLPPRTLGRIVAPVLQAPRILGDSLPAGAYTAAVRIRLVQPRDTTLVIPAGSIDLSTAETEVEGRRAGLAAQAPPF